MVFYSSRDMRQHLGWNITFSELFTCRVGGSLTSSKIVFLYQLPSYCTLHFINISLWSKDSFLQLQLTPHGLSSLLFSWTRCYHLQLCATEVGYCAVTSKWWYILSALLWRTVQSRVQWKDNCLFPWRTTIHSIFLYTQGSFLARKGRKQGSCIFLIPSKSLQSEGFAHKHTLHFWSKQKVQGTSHLSSPEYFCFVKRNRSQYRGDSCPAMWRTTFLR